MTWAHLVTVGCVAPLAPHHPILVVPAPLGQKDFRMAKLLALLVLILGAALALFGAQNEDQVALHFLWFSSRTVPVSLAILGAAGVSLLVGLLIMLPGRLTARRIAGRLQRDAEATRVTKLP